MKNSNEWDEINEESGSFGLQKPFDKLLIIVIILMMAYAISGCAYLPIKIRHVPGIEDIGDYGL